MFQVLNLLIVSTAKDVTQHVNEAGHECTERCPTVEGIWVNWSAPSHGNDDGEDDEASTTLLDFVGEAYWINITL